MDRLKSRLAAAPFRYPKKVRKLTVLLMLSSIESQPKAHF